jgi:hypothetical protein
MTTLGRSWPEQVLPDLKAYSDYELRVGSGGGPRFYPARVDCQARQFSRQQLVPCRLEQTRDDCCHVTLARAV